MTNKNSQNLLTKDPAIKALDEILCCAGVLDRGGLPTISGKADIKRFSTTLLKYFTLDENGEIILKQ